MARVFVHDPADACHCSFCGIKEDIHLLDGVIDAHEQGTDSLACIRCYPNDGWCCSHHDMVDMSIAPSLKPFYDQYRDSERWNEAQR
jgi:hypothetical protein